MSLSGNRYLDHGSSDESDLDNGYDSEAAELTKDARAATTQRSTKRRKLSHSEDEDLRSPSPDPITVEVKAHDLAGDQEAATEADGLRQDNTDAKTAALSQIPQSRIGETDGDAESRVTKSNKKSKEKQAAPGVVYLSSLPPYLKPSALRNLLTQRGFEPITRLFLTPASKAKSSSKKNSRQLYTEGWVEFGSKKTARRCAETLNAEIVGGKKGGFYHDDLWNMKYLKGMGWDELMAGIREERREEEGRRDEERRTIASETKRFIEGVEEGRRVEGIKRKRKDKAGRNNDGTDGGTEDVKRTWRQFGVKGKGSGGTGTTRQGEISKDAQEVLGKIF